MPNLDLLKNKLVTPVADGLENYAAMSHATMPDFTDFDIAGLSVILLTMSRKAFKLAGRFNKESSPQFAARNTLNGFGGGLAVMGSMELAVTAGSLIHSYRRSHQTTS